MNLGIVPGECITLLDSEGKMGDELLAILTNQETEYTGQVLCDNRDIKEAGKSCLDSKMIVLDDNPTCTFLFQEMSYLENLCFLLDRKLGKSVIKSSYIASIRNEYYKETGKTVDVSDIRFLPLKEKYGLIYNKICLFHPKVLIIRRPFAYGDMNCRNYILKRIRQLKDAGVCILLITNYITDCLYITDQICILKNGTNIVSLQPEEYDVISRIF